MTDLPSPPDDSNPTTRYDPPPADRRAVPAEAGAAAPGAEAPDAAAPGAAVPPPPPPSPATPAPSPPPPMAPSPTWRSRRDDPGRTGTIVFGVILVAVGLWFFADQTLGLDMPRVRWSELWPLLIIAIGAWIVLGSIRRSR